MGPLVGTREANSSPCSVVTRKGAQDPARKEKTAQEDTGLYRAFLGRRDPRSSSEMSHQERLEETHPMHLSCERHGGGALFSEMFEFCIMHTQYSCNQKKIRKQGKKIHRGQLPRPLLRNA